MTMDRKEQEAADALATALAALSTAIVKCGDAKLSFMNVIEPLMGSHECIGTIRNIVMGES
jgi:hypothetical protein